VSQWSSANDGGQRSGAGRGSSQRVLRAKGRVEWQTETAGARQRSTAVDTTAELEKRDEATAARGIRDATATSGRLPRAQEEGVEVWLEPT
jgi:hypothetical protein